MRVEQMKYVCDTVEYLKNLLYEHRGKTFEQIKDVLNNEDCKLYSIDITNEEEDLFDVDVGVMNFTIYKTDNNGFRLCENATYYMTSQETDGTFTTYFDDPVSIEL